LENPERYWVVYPSWFMWASALEPEDLRNLAGQLHRYSRTGQEIAHQSLPPIPYQIASLAQASFGLITSATETASLVEAAQDLRTQTRLQGGMRKPVLLHNLDNMRYYIPGTTPDKVTPAGLIPGYLTLLLLSAAACALACGLLARRQEFSWYRCSSWALCGLLFGWVGLMLMLAVHDWPPRVPCPRCRRRRIVTRETREHCGAQHASPSMDGTEIFEPCGAPAEVLLHWSCRMKKPRPTAQGSSVTIEQASQACLLAASTEYVGSASSHFTSPDGP
jgi:hypothetical protein